jgi:protein-S-isoprenylcysteine O-methyltransferase Ste14
MNGTFLLVATSILWGVAHSALASNRAKELAARLFGQIATNRLYRFSYNLFSAASFLPILVLLLALPDQPIYNIPAPWVYLTAIAQGLSAIALMAGVMQTGLWEFIGLSQLNLQRQPVQAKLTIAGLYSYVRHPLYTAGLVFI